jgi:Uncharacterized protein conserved in bacteria
MTGLALFLGSCVPLGYSIYMNLLVEPAVTIPLQDESHTYAGQVSVAPGRPVKITLKIDVTTRSVQEITENDKTTYQGRYRFPAAFTVTGTNGAELTRDNSGISWDSGTRFWTPGPADSLSAQLVLQHTLGEFTAPASGIAIIYLDLAPDTTYQADFSNAELLVYDNLVDDNWYIATWVVMLLLGVILSMVGLIFIVSNMAAGSAAGNDGSTAAARDHANIGNVHATVSSPLFHRQAMWIHLSGFAGYLVPLTNIIAPVALWMIWRERDPYVDAQGREAINFQLTILIYLFASLLLTVLLVGFFLVIMLFIFHIAFMTAAAVHASRGEHFRYPMILRLIR